MGDSHSGMDDELIPAFRSSDLLPSMLMYFHQRVGEVIMWKEWVPETTGEYIGAIVAIVMFGVASVALRTLKSIRSIVWRKELQISPHHHATAPQTWGGLSLTLDYFNMLVAMTFNIGLFCAVVAGYIIGVALMSHLPENYAAMVKQRQKASEASAAPK
eukprot:gene9706-7573_t